MALIKMKPTSPGTRFVVKVDRSHLHKGGPIESLTTKKNRTGARNHSGRQTTRHIGGGHKQRYRIVDFKRDKDGIPGVVERLEYDPNRTSHLALVLYKDGERRYILAPKGVKAGDEIRSGADAPIKAGNALPLRHIPVGSTVHNIELKVGKGGQMARSAGASAQFAAREGVSASVRLKSVDHPHGGGEGKSGQGNPHPVSPWGLPTKGYKTRRNKRTDSMILQRRKNKRI
jgi:large subunit ribosomal protein L2